MSRTNKNGKQEKYNKVNKFGGGDVSKEDKFAIKRKKRLEHKKQRQLDKKIIKDETNI